MIKNDDNMPNVGPVAFHGSGVPGRNNIIYPSTTGKNRPKRVPFFISLNDDDGSSILIQLVNPDDNSFIASHGIERNDWIELVTLEGSEPAIVTETLPEGLIRLGYESGYSSEAIDGSTVQRLLSHQATDGLLHGFGAPSSPPVNTSLPVASGSPFPGQTISSTDGTWTGSPTPTFAYQWQKNGADIAGATFNTLAVSSVDDLSHGNTLRCRVTATNSSGSVSADSNSLTVVFPPSVSSPASITGASTPAATLTAVNPTWTNGAAFLSREWFKNGSPTGITTPTYNDTQHGDAVFVRIVGSNAAGSASSDSEEVNIAGIPTHANLSPLGISTVKPVCWTNDEISDAYSEKLLWAMHILGKIDLVWQDQTSATNANTANNSNNYNPTLTSAYYAQEITAWTNDLALTGTSGWDNTVIPARAGAYEGHIPIQTTIAGATRPSTSSPSVATLIAAVNANYSPGQPVLFVVGGPLTTLADAYLSLSPGSARDDFAAKITVLFVSGSPTVTSEGWYNEWADSMAARIVFKYFTCVCFPTSYAAITNVNIANNSNTGTCVSTVPLFVGQTIVGSGIPAATYITATNGSSTFTLSNNVSPAITAGTRFVNSSFPAVPKAWIQDRLPDSPLRTRMFAQTRPGNTLPAGIDGDASPLICLLDTTYVLTVQRYSVTNDANGGQVVSIDQDAGGSWPARNCPLPSADVSGNLWYCTSCDAVKATNAWWNTMLDATLWLRSSSYTLSVVGSDNFNRADNAILGTGWSTVGAMGRNQVISGTAGKSTTGYAADVRSETYSNDQYAQMKFTSTPVASYFPAIGIRATHFSGDNINAYYFVPIGSTNSILQRTISAVSTAILNGMPVVAANNQWRVCVKGNLISVWRNNGAESGGIIISGWRLMGVIQDTGITTGKPGMLNSRSAGPTSFSDDFAAGNIT